MIAILAGVALALALWLVVLARARLLVGPPGRHRPDTVIPPPDGWSPLDARLRREVRIQVRLALACGRDG